MSYLRFHHFNSLVETCSELVSILLTKDTLQLFVNREFATNSPGFGKLVWRCQKLLKKETVDYEEFKMVMHVLDNYYNSCRFCLRTNVCPLNSRSRQCQSCFDQQLSKTRLVHLQKQLDKEKVKWDKDVLPSLPWVRAYLEGFVYLDLTIDSCGLFFTHPVVKKFLNQPGYHNVFVHLWRLTRFDGYPQLKRYLDDLQKRVKYVKETFQNKAIDTVPWDSPIVRDFFQCYDTTRDCIKNKTNGFC